MITILLVIIEIIGYVFVLIYFGVGLIKEFIKFFFSIFKKH